MLVKMRRTDGLRNNGFPAASVTESPPVAARPSPSRGGKRTNPNRDEEMPLTEKENATDGKPMPPTEEANTTDEDTDAADEEADNTSKKRKRLPLGEAEDRLFRMRSGIDSSGMRLYA